MNNRSTVALFEYATRTKIRFPSVRGELSVEQLWDVPLRGKNGSEGFDLNSIAKACSKALKEATEESFVEVKRTPEMTRLETALELVKYVIEVKLDEEESAKRKAQNRVEKEKLLEILAEKQAGKLSALSEKELQKRIEALEE